MQITVLLLLIALWLGQSQGHGEDDHKPEHHIPELKQLKKQMQPLTKQCANTNPADKTEEKGACDRVQKTNQIIDELIGYLQNDKPTDVTAAQLNTDIRAIFDNNVENFTKTRQSTRDKLEKLSPGEAGALERRYDRMEMNGEKVQTLQNDMKILAKQLENKKVHFTDKQREAINYEILLILLKLHLYSMASYGYYANTMSCCPLPSEEQHQKTSNFAELVTRKKRSPTAEQQQACAVKKTWGQKCWACLVEVGLMIGGYFAILGGAWSVVRGCLGVVFAVFYVALQVVDAACLMTFGLACVCSQPNLMLSFCMCGDTPGNNVIKWRFKSKAAKEQHKKDRKDQSCCGCWPKLFKNMGKWYDVGNEALHFGKSEEEEPAGQQEEVSYGVPMQVAAQQQQHIPPHQGLPEPYAQQEGPYGPQGHYGQGYPPQYKGGHPGGTSGR